MTADTDNCGLAPDTTLSTIELHTKVHTKVRSLVTEKDPDRAFSLLKTATTAFTFKTLLRY